MATPLGGQFFSWPGRFGGQGGQLIISLLNVGHMLLLDHHTPSMRHGSLKQHKKMLIGDRMQHNFEKSHVLSHLNSVFLLWFCNVFIVLFEFNGGDLKGIVQQWQVATNNNDLQRIRELEAAFEAIKITEYANSTFLFDLLFWQCTAYELIWEVYDKNIAKNLPLKWRLKFKKTNQYYTTHTGHSDQVKMSEVLPALLLYFGVYTLYTDKIGINSLWIDNVELEYNKTNSKLKSGIEIEVFEYHLPLSQFDNTSINPSYPQYYRFGPSCVFNLTSCYDSIPLFVSFSYFLCPPDVRYFLGAPDVSGHNIEMDTREPTGAIFAANALMRLNFAMNSLPIKRNKLSDYLIKILKRLAGLFIPSYNINF